eukprot:8649519-Ditylum_brightwellii.AAC.1
MAADLANDLLRCKDWDPEELNPPHAEKLSILPPSLLDENIPLTQAKDPDVIVPPDLEGKVDDFIDDSIGVGLYDKSS